MFLIANLSSQPDEEYYACKWSMNEETLAPILLLGGKKGVLRVIDCGETKLVEVGIKEFSMLTA